MRFAQRQGLLVVALVTLVCAVPAAAGAASQTTSREANLCGAAKGFALSLQKAPTTRSLAAEQSQLKTNLNKLTAAKGSLIAAAPAPLKGDLGNVIGLYKHLRADLVKTNWSLAALEASPTTVAALLAEADRDKSSFTHLNKYFTKTCHY
jgi:hypothetical protein